MFSAGHDLKEMTLHRADADGGRAFFEKTMRLCADLMQAIVRLPKPVIAEIDGLATAAGCQLVASCDLAICTDTSGLLHAGRQYRPVLLDADGGASRNVHRKQAMEMLLTGETIDAGTRARNSASSTASCRRNISARWCRNTPRPSPRNRP